MTSIQKISRKEMKNIILALLTFILLSTPEFTKAAEPELLSIKKITDNVYNLSLNVGVVIGDEFVVLIEGGYGEYKDSNKKILAAVKSLTNKPIKYLINMHSHNDHSGGNMFFSELGVTIISQKNAMYSRSFEENYPKENIIFIDETYQLDLGNEVIEIEHMVAHTFDDAIIYLKKSNLIFIGESYKPNYLTYLGLFGLESFETWGQKALSKMNENTLAVPSHGESVIGKSQLLFYRNNVKNWYSRVLELYQQGQNADQIAKDKLAESFVNKSNLDKNPAHHEGYYHKAIAQLIRFDMYKHQKVTPSMIQQLQGKYKRKNSDDIEIVFEKGKLIAKQENGIIYWLKPLSNNVLEAMTPVAEQYVFDNNASGNTTKLTINFPNESFYQEKLMGDWHK